MRYITRADIQQAIPTQTLIWLSADDPVATVPDWNVVEHAAAVAETMVDGYLMGRYRYPLNTDSADLRQIVASLARHTLYSRRPEGNDLPEAVKAGFKWAITTLEQARDGRYQISGQTGAMQQSPGGMRVRSRARVFGDDTLDAM